MSLPCGVSTGEGHTVGQVLVDALVAGHACGINVLQLKDDTLRLLLGHPLVEPQQRPASG